MSNLCVLFYVMKNKHKFYTYQQTEQTEVTFYITLRIFMFQAPFPKNKYYLVILFVRKYIMI